MGTTPVYNFPFPELTASPHSPDQVEALALAVESKFSSVDAAALKPVATLYQNSTQNITNNTWTAITFDAESFDSHNAHSTVTNNSRWTVPSGWAGYYAVVGVPYFATGATGTRAAAIAVNGSRVNGTQVRFDTTGDGFGTAFTVGGGIMLQLSVGDYVELHAIHTQGATIATFVGLPATSSLSIAFQRPL